MNAPQTKPIVSICAWCDDSTMKTLLAVSAGYEVTHGICDKCAESLNTELNNREHSPSCETALK